MWRANYSVEWCRRQEDHLTPLEWERFPSSTNGAKTARPLPTRPMTTAAILWGPLAITRAMGKTWQRATGPREPWLLTRTTPLCCLLLMQSNSIASLSLQQLRRAVALKEPVAAFEAELGQVFGDPSSAASIKNPSWSKSLTHASIPLSKLTSIA